MTMIQCALDYKSRDVVDSDSDSESNDMRGYTDSEGEQGGVGAVGGWVEETENITVRQLVGFRRDDQLRPL